MTDPLRITLITLGDPTTLTGGYLYHRRMAEFAPRFDAQINFVSFPEWPFPLAAADARTVLRAARNVGADVLVLDSICAAFLGPWLVRNEPPVPLVGMMHQPPGGIDFGPPRSVVQAWLDRLAYRRAHRLLVASEHLAEQLRATGFPPQRIEVVPPGRDVAPASGPPAGDLRRGRRAALLCVGNWVERKGILDLLDAFAGLPDNAAALHLAGSENVDPAYGAEVRRRLARPDLSGRVVRHGAVPVEGVAALYAAADAFVLPSRKEPYGTVYGEAMDYGLPVIGWRAGNLPYLAEHEREGLIVPTGDIAALTGAMRRLVEDVEFRRRLGDAARARALTRPTWEASAGLLFDALRRVACS
jgi:glycosyltransferase involved in cell wall biosynthesis